MNHLHTSLTSMLSDSWIPRLQWDWKFLNYPEIAFDRTQHRTLAQLAYAKFLAPYHQRGSVCFWYTAKHRMFLYQSTHPAPNYQYKLPSYEVSFLYSARVPSSLPFYVLHSWMSNSPHSQGLHTLQARSIIQHTTLAQTDFEAGYPYLHVNIEKETPQSLPKLSNCPKTASCPYPLYQTVFTGSPIIGREEALFSFDTKEGPEIYLTLTGLCPFQMFRRFKTTKWFSGHLSFLCDESI